MAYDRDVVVSCITRHYDLLVRAAYLDPAAIEAPPPEGWSDEQLMVDVLRVLGRSEKVVDLLRHLPYIKPPEHPERYEVYVETKSINYLRNHNPNLTVESCRGKTLDDCHLDLVPDEADYPSSFISLTRGREATWWIIDTDEGLIFPVGYSLVNSEAPRDQPWRRGAHPRDIWDYFDEVYEEFVSLKQVPMPKGKRSWYCRVAYGADNDGKVVKKLLEEHGWPDALNKEEYLRALKEQHPDDS